MDRYIFFSFILSKNSQMAPEKVKTCYLNQVFISDSALNLPELYLPRGEKR